MRTRLPSRLPWRCRSVSFLLAATLSALLPVLPAAADEEAPASSDGAIALQLAPGRLPELGRVWRPANPYRGQPRAAEVGAELFQQGCARCHGAEADGSGAAPDLRVLDKYCQRLAPGPWQQRCLSDVDHHFVTAVRFGKVRVGITHMPAWDRHLSQEMIWALRTHVEELSRRQTEKQRERRREEAR